MTLLRMPSRHLGNSKHKQDKRIRRSFAQKTDEVCASNAPPNNWSWFPRSIPIVDGFLKCALPKAMGVSQSYAKRSGRRQNGRDYPNSPRTDHSLIRMWETLGYQMRNDYKQVWVGASGKAEQILQKEGGCKKELLGKLTNWRNKLTGKLCQPTPRMDSISNNCPGKEPAPLPPKTPEAENKPNETIEFPNEVGRR